MPADSLQPIATPGEQRKRLRAIVHGRVQGVSFRYYTVEQAEGLGLAGYVCNLWDRTVEVVAEGPERDLQALLSWLYEGPSMARVTRVDVQWQPATGQFHDFEVRY
jgi:acylphosphatase